MRIYDDKVTLDLATKAWKSFYNAEQMIDTLQYIGLDVNGSSDKGNVMGGLYRVQTAAANQIRTLFHVPDNTADAEFLDSILKAESGSAENTDGVFPARILGWLKARHAAPSNENGKPYDVTVAMAGTLRVQAASESDAIEQANAMDSATLLMDAIWMSPEATDVCDCEEA